MSNMSLEKQPVFESEDSEQMPMLQRLRIEALSLAIASAPFTALKAEDLTQNNLFERARDIESFIKSARCDA